MHLYLGLGSNLGHRQQLLDSAIGLLREQIGQLLACSQYYETQPVDMESVHPFFNAVVLFDSSLTPIEVLHITQQIERQLGRTRKSSGGQHYDRPIDIDLLQMGDIVMHTEELTLPHPLLTQRDFVLEPLAEIAPEGRYALPPHQSFGELWANKKAYTLCELTQAQPDDWKAITHLLPQLTPHGILTWEHFKACIESDNNYIAALFNQNQLVGTVSLCLTKSPSGTKAWIEDLIIDQQHRGKGLSHQLLDWAKKKAKILGAKKLLLTSRPERLVANALYQGEDFQLRRTNVYQYEL